MKISEYLFKGMQGCSNHSCIVKKPEGMGTNGGCTCMFNLSRTQLMILGNKIKAIGDKEITS